MTDVYSGTVTGTGSDTVGAVDTSYTVNDAITVDLTYQFHVSGNVVHYDVIGSVVQNVTTITKITQDGKTSTSTFAKSLISDFYGKEPAVDGGTIFSLAGAIGTNSSESLYFNFPSLAARPILLVGGSVTVEGTTVPLQGGLYPGVFVPPTLLYAYYSFIDLFRDGHTSPLGISDPLVPSPLLGFSLTAGDPVHPENSANISAEAPHANTLALLGNYIASSFPTATGGHAGTLAPQTEQQLTLTNPHG